DVFRNILFGNVVEVAVRDAQIANGRISEAPKLERVLALAAGDVANVDVADQRLFRPLLTLFVGKVDLPVLIRDFADLDVEEVDVLDGTAAHRIGLEAQRLIQLRTVEFAVLKEHIAHAAGHFAADGQRAVAVLHFAIADDDVLARNRHAASVPIAA